MKGRLVTALLLSGTQDGLVEGPPFIALRRRDKKHLGYGYGVHAVVKSGR